MISNFSRPVRFAVVGVVNSAVHVVVLVIFFWSGFSQAVANFLAFFVAATFSYLANGFLTFQIRPNILRYMVFLVVNGSVAYGFGFLADLFGWPVLFTMISFSIVSYVVGYFGGKRWVFVS